jgi:hypothetical protein
MVRPDREESSRIKVKAGVGRTAGKGRNTKRAGRIRRQASEKKAVAVL